MSRSFQLVSRTGHATNAVLADPFLLTCLQRCCELLNQAGKQSGLRESGAGLWRCHQPDCATVSVPQRSNDIAKGGHTVLLFGCSILRTTDQPRPSFVTFRYSWSPTCAATSIALEMAFKFARERIVQLVCAVNHTLSATWHAFTGTIDTIPKHGPGYERVRRCNILSQHYAF